MAQNLKQASCEVYQPVVKFRNIDTQTLGKVKETELEKGNGKESESESDDEPLSCPGPRSVDENIVPFEVDIDIDIKSPWLRDLLSDNNLELGDREPVVQAASKSKDGTEVDLDTLFERFE